MSNRVYKIVSLLLLIVGLVLFFVFWNLAGFGDAMIITLLYFIYLKLPPRNIEEK